MRRGVGKLFGHASTTFVSISIFGKCHIRIHEATGHNADCLHRLILLIHPISPYSSLTRAAQNFTAYDTMEYKGPGQSAFADSATGRISPDAKPVDKVSDGVLCDDGTVLDDDGAGEALPATPISTKAAPDQLEPPTESHANPPPISPRCPSPPPPTTVNHGGGEPTSVSRPPTHKLFGLKANGTQAQTGNRCRHNFMIPNTDSLDKARQDSTHMTTGGNTPTILTVKRLAQTLEFG